MTALTVALALLSAAGEPARPDRDRVIKGARQVVAAVVEAARENSRRKKPRAGDELTAFYVQAAARSARSLPEGESAPAFLAGVGVALDTARLLRTVPLLGLTWKRIESDAERKARLAVLGTPTVHGRHDLAQHFAVSAALTALVGDKLAESAGEAKEWMDSGEGGSGFSFADLAADLCGVEFGRQVLKSPRRLAEVEKGFRTRDYALAPGGLEEGLSRKEFERRYGGLGDERFRKAREGLLAKIGKLPGLRAGR